MQFKSVKDQMRPILHLTDAEIAYKLGCGTRTVEDRRRKIGYENGEGGQSRHIWPDEDIALATKLWLGGFSGSEISNRLGCRYTRAAVIAKMTRLGVKSPRKRGDSTPAQVLARKKCKPRIVVSNPTGPPLRPSPIPQPHADDVARFSFNDMDFDRQCNWPVGDVVLSHVKQFCGDHRDGPSPYCGAHTRRAYGPNGPPRRYVKPDAPGRVMLKSVGSMAFETV